MRPKTYGAAMVIRNNNEILLIKTTYGYTYSLPGGGIKEGEQPVDAAKRETFEEVGIRVTEAVALPPFTTHENNQEDTVYSFYSEVSSKEYRLDLLEIDVAEWHSIDRLPTAITPATKKILELYTLELRKNTTRLLST